MWDVALSTMWAVGQFERLEDFFRTAQALGFAKFELNHQITSQMLDGVNLTNYRFSGVHEPCPADLLPAEMSDRNWLISSLNEEGRRHGIAAVKRSIDLAQELGGAIVIVHTGRVDIDARIESELWQMYEAGQADSQQYQELKADLWSARAKTSVANLEAVRRSLDELLTYASTAGIRLALENRYHFLDMPLPNEMAILLTQVSQECAGFLYDVGHAQTLENLGFVQHEEWLQRFGSRMVGVHMHDIRGLRDHYAAGLGEVDWDLVARYLPKDVIRTCEFQTRNTPAQLAAALGLLSAKGCIERSKE